MQETHPDRGGDAAEFCRANREFNAARNAEKRAPPEVVKARKAAREAEQAEAARRFREQWPDGMPRFSEMDALQRAGVPVNAANLRTYRAAARAAETKTAPPPPETKTKHAGGRPPGVSVFAKWYAETKTPRASAYRMWAAFMAATGETKTAARADAAALAAFIARLEVAE